MPQDIEVFPGTVSENIARFKEFQPEDVIAAAQSAGVHDMILHFPEGYDTRIGDGGMGLSGGQKQRLALARALYGKPNLVVLDEPNSNLDEVGEAALVRAIQELQARKASVIVITHRIPILQVTNKLLLLQDGNARMFGPSAQVMQALQGKPAANGAPASAATTPSEQVSTSNPGAATAPEAAVPKPRKRIARKRVLKETVDMVDIVEASAATTPDKPAEAA